MPDEVSEAGRVTLIRDLSGTVAAVAIMNKSGEIRLLPTADNVFDLLVGEEGAAFRAVTIKGEPSTLPRLDYTPAIVREMSKETAARVMITRDESPDSAPPQVLVDDVAAIGIPEAGPTLEKLYQLDVDDRREIFLTLELLKLEDVEGAEANTPDPDAMELHLTRLALSRALNSSPPGAMLRNLAANIDRRLTAKRMNGRRS